MSSGVAVIARFGGRRPNGKVILEPVVERFVSIPLSRAVLCQNCESVSDATGPTCPVCQSEALMSIQKVLDR